MYKLVLPLINFVDESVPIADSHWYRGVTIFTRNFNGKLNLIEYFYFNNTSNHF